MSGTTVYYNGVLFRDCETIDYQSSVEYDETQTRSKFMRTRITVASTLISLHEIGGSGIETLLTQHQSTIALPPIDDSTVPGRLEEIKARLSDPGKDFWYAVHSVNDKGPKPIAGEASLFEPVPDSGPIGFSYRLVLVATGIVPIGSEDRFIELFNNKLTVERKNVLDANSGPKPSNLAVKDIMGGRAVRVQVTFDVCRVLSKAVEDVEPEYDAQTCKGIICNTWKVVDSLGDDGAVTHNVTGKITVKDRRYKPNALRIAAFPLPFPFSRLVDRKYSTNESGLTLEYSHTFRHAGVAPPEGVRNFEASYVESVKMGMHGKTSAKMNITVWGWNHRELPEGTTFATAEQVQKQMLVRGLHTILWARIRGIAKQWNPLPGQEAKHCLLQEATVSEQVGKPRLDMSVSVLWASQHLQEFAVRMNNLGVSLGDGIGSYDPRWWPVDNEWGRLTDEDASNPNFDNEDIYPWALEGDPELSDYFTGYVHSPGSHRQTLPRITGETKQADDFVDDSYEWARAGGGVPAEEEEEESEDAVTPSTNPYNSSDLQIALSRDLKGDLVLGPLAQVENASYSAIADVQASGFSYMQWDSEVLSDTTEGVITLPLSAPRVLTSQRMVNIEQNGAYFPGHSGSGSAVAGMSISGKECSIALRLHAPKTKRIVSITATRINKPPQMPHPVQQIVRHSKSSSLMQVSCIETLERKELLSENAVLLADNVTRQFSVSLRYVYSMSNPWEGSTDEGVGDANALPFGVDPTMNVTAQQNTIVVRGTAGNAAPLFNSELTLYG